MSMCKCEFVTVILLAVLLGGLINFEEAYAGLGANSCDGECQPPSLGLDLKESRRYVNDGFGINGQFYDVNYFSQTIPTQNFTVGDTVNVRLTIFENSGPQYLEYVGLSIVVDEPFVRGGLLVEEYESTIAWIKKFDGIKSIDVDDSYDLIDIINVTDSVENSRTILDYKFIVTNPIESKTIKVKMWDYKRNVWNNYFHEAITVTEKDSKLIIPFGNETISPDIKNIDKSNIPSWIRTNAGWWSTSQISDEEFTKGIEYLIQNDIIKVRETLASDSSTSDHIPSWLQKNAGWWSQGLLSDEDFVKGIQYLVNNGIIRVTSNVESLCSGGYTLCNS